MRFLGAYVVVCLGLVLFGAVGDQRPFTLTVYPVVLASVAIVACGFNVLRARTLRRILGRIKDAAPRMPSGLVEAPSAEVAALLGELRTLGFRDVATTETAIEGAPTMATWVMTGEPGTTWVEVGMAASPMAIFLSQAADGRMLETSTAGGELIDHPALFARTLDADPAAALAAHRATLAEWEARSGPARVVRTLDEYLEAEEDLRRLTGGLRIATYLDRVVEPGIRRWAMAAVIASLAVAALWGLDAVRR